MEDNGQHTILNYVLLAVFAVLILMTIILSWVRFILHDDFTYVLTEESQPSIFDPRTY